MAPRRRQPSSTCSSASACSRNEPRMAGPVLAFVEHAGGEPDRLSLESLALARGLATNLGVPLEAVLLGSGTDAVASHLGAHGVGHVHVAIDPRLDDFAPAAWGA